MNPDILQFTLDLCMKVIDSINANDSVAMLNQTSILLKLQDKEFLKDNNLIKIKEKIDKTLTNEKNMRVLRMMQTIKTEVDTRIEYFDADIGADHRLFYQQEMEQEMISFEQEIRKAISTIITELKTEEGIDVG